MDKFVLESKTIWGNLISILTVLGTLGYISFTPDQAGLWTALGIGVITLGGNLLSIYGRYKAEGKLYTVKQ
jgi:hypothetical protein